MTTVLNLSGGPIHHPSKIRAEGRKLAAYLKTYCAHKKLKILGAPEMPNIDFTHGKFIDGVRVIWQYDTGASGLPEGIYLRADIIVDRDPRRKPKPKRKQATRATRPR